MNTTFLLFIGNLLILFIVKVIDNILSTSKTILIQKNKGILAALFATISQIIFYKLIDAVQDSSNDFALYVISFATGVGTYLAVILSNKFSKDRIFVNVLLSDNKEEMVKLRDFLKEHKITNLATDGYTKNWQKTIAITAYTETRAENKLLDNYIRNSDNKFKRIMSVL